MNPRYAAKSDPGRKRDNNEDKYLTLPDVGLFMVADGMGGHNAGEVASAMAVEAIAEAGKGLVRVAMRQPWWKRLLFRRRETFNPVEWLHRVIIDANGRIFEAARSSAGRRGMGTTMALILKRETALLTAHVGDSRVYRFRRGKLAQLTQDHSLAQELVLQGIMTEEEALYAAPSNVLTRALGVKETVSEDIIYHSLEPGDVYLLCSDGLYNMVDDADLQRIVGLNTSLEERADQLVRAANEGGGTDNITVVLAQFS